jgi:predicted ATPase/transcriptional regulator with XRE-family HTH domain
VPRDRGVARSELAPPATAETFGGLLRELRLRAGFSQEELAERAGISAAAVGTIERGLRRAPHKATVALLGNALALDDAERAHLESAAARARGRSRHVEAATAHLPTPASSLVGREDDVANLMALIGRSRLVTVTGSGGVGKTRTALEVAARIAERSAAVCFVDFAPLTDGSYIASRIASSLQPPLDARPESIHALAEAIAGRTMLLVLDTCEHIIGDAAAAAHAILERCPRVSLLATSRERLNVASENVYRLPSLPTDIAVELFVERAAEADPSVALTHEDERLVASVCARLEGMPLAIELAAARVPMLGVATLHARLDEYMSLAGGRRDLPQRQQTMLAAIAWSCDLLANRERALLQRLSVFRGGFTLAAAERVCGDALETPVLTQLASLVDKSLVDAVRTQDSVRYRLLDSVRAYAAAELRGTNDETDAFRRHAHWIAALGDPFASDTLRMSFAEFQALLPEFDNVRAAIAWALDARDVDDRILAAHIIYGLRSLWHVTGHISEQRRWIDAALERIEEETHPREVGMLLHTFILRSWNESTVVPKIERAVVLLERVGDGNLLAALHSTLTFIYATLGRFAEADASAQRAATLLTEQGKRGTLVYAAYLTNRAGLRTEEGRLEDARADIAEAEEIAALKDRSFLVSRCMPRSMAIEFELGNIERAIEIAREMLASEFGSAAEVRINALEALMYLHLTLGRIEQAAEAAVSLLGCVHNDIAPWCHIAVILVMRGYERAAARLLGFIDAIYADSLLPRASLEQRSYEMLQAELPKRLPQRTIAALADDGARLAPQDAIAEAVAALSTPARPALFLGDR